MTNQLPTSNHQDNGPTFLSGLLSFLGMLPGDHVSEVHIKDNPLQAFVKSMLGGIAFARSEGSEVTIKFNTEAQKVAAEGAREAAKIDAEARGEADKIRAQAEQSINNT